MSKRGRNGILFDESWRMIFAVALTSGRFWLGISRTPDRSGKHLERRSGCWNYKSRSVISTICVLIRNTDDIYQDGGISEQGYFRTPPSPLLELPGDANKWMAVLHPVWALLPSPEASDAKFANQRQFPK